MKGSRFGMLAAGAVAGLLGSAGLAQAADEMKGGGQAKACYRTQCGKSVKGHEGQCGGTRVDGIGDQKACETAGGAWTTEADAARFKKKEG